jgi:hypothetical protein
VTSKSTVEYIQERNLLDAKYVSRAFHTMEILWPMGVPTQERNLTIVMYATRISHKGEV